MTLCRITNINRPESALAGEGFILGGEYINEGIDGPTFMRLMDTETYEFLNVAASYPSHPTGETKGMASHVVMPAKSWKLTIEVGEGSPIDPISVHDSKSFIIVNPEFPPEEESLLRRITNTILIIGPLIAGTIAIALKPRR